MLTVYGSSWLGIDANTDPDIGQLFYNAGITGNKFITATVQDLEDSKLSKKNSNALIDGRDVHFGDMCSCVNTAWFGGEGPGLMGGTGPRPPVKCLAYLRYECLKNPALPFCDPAYFNVVNSEVRARLRRRRLSDIERPYSGASVLLTPRRSLLSQKGTSRGTLSSSCP